MKKVDQVPNDAKAVPRHDRSEISSSTFSAEVHLLCEAHRENITKTGKFACTTSPKYVHLIAWKLDSICLDAPAPAAGKTIVRQTMYSASDIMRGAKSARCSTKLYANDE